MTELRAIEAFTAPGPTHVAKGDVAQSGDPIVAGREHLFEPVSPPPFLAPEQGDDTGTDVGESGPELAKLPPGGKIIPKPKRGDKAATAVEPDP